MTWLDYLGRDVRQAARAIVRMPVLATVVVVSLAIGIGVNAAIFSWIQGLVFKPLPGVRDAASFQLIEPRSDIGSHVGTSWLEYRDLRERLDVVSRDPRVQDGAAHDRRAAEHGPGVRTARLRQLLLGPRARAVVRPVPDARRGVATGRASPSSSSRTDSGRRDSAARRTSWGARIRVNEQDLTVIGVAPPKFQGTVTMLDFDLWIPATMAPVLFAGSRELEDRASRGYDMMARLRPNATREQAQREADDAMASLGAALSRDERRDVDRSLPVLEDAARAAADARRRAGDPAGHHARAAAGGVREHGESHPRARDRATTRGRHSPGVRREPLARREPAHDRESPARACSALSSGHSSPTWGTNALRAVPMIGAFPIRFQTSLDGNGPGVRDRTRPSVRSHLRRRARASALARRTRTASCVRARARHRRGRLRNALMGAQVALAVIVLVAAALFYRSFSETREMDPGFRREGVLLAAYDLSGRNADSTAARLFAARLLEKGARAAVGGGRRDRDVGAARHSRLARARASTLEGRARSDAGRDLALTQHRDAGLLPDHGHSASRGPHVRGSHRRGCAASGDRERGIRAPVSGWRRAARASSHDAGRNVHDRRRGEDVDVRLVRREAEADHLPLVPRPAVGRAARFTCARASGSETLLAPEVQRIVRELDPTLPVYDVRTLVEHVDKNLFLRKIPARMFVVLGPLLLVLAAIGIYAVVAYTVSHRTAEIGVRIALGATAARVVRQIVRETLRVVGHRRDRGRGRWRSWSRSTSCAARRSTS